MGARRRALLSEASGRGALLAGAPAEAKGCLKGAVVGGVATATEVSTIGIIYSILTGLLIYRQFDWRRVYPMLVSTASLSGALRASGWALRKRTSG